MDNKSKKIIIHNFILYLLSLLLPGIITATALFFNGIFWGSTKTILIYDMGQQYASFLYYFHHLGDGFNNLMYQTLSGMGGGYYGTWAYYTLSPISLLILLFDLDQLPDAIYLITLIKIALSGLTMSFYLKKGRLHIEKSYICIVGAVSYALMSFSIMYMMMPMWLDGIIMLPLVILGVDRIVEKDDNKAFVFSLALSLILNYYISFMTVVFVVIYYFYLVLSENYKFKPLVKKTLLMAGSGTISVLMSSWVWLPVMIDFGRGKLVEGKKDIGFEIRNIFAVLRQFLPVSYGGFRPSDGPNIYSGSVVLLFFVLFLFSKKNSRKKRLLATLIVVIYIASMCIGYLDVLWHGLKIPNMFPARYSFTLSFFMICIAAEFAGNLSVRFVDIKANYIRVLCSLSVTFAVADLSFNAFFIIRCIDVDDFTGQYYDYDEYGAVKDRNEMIADLTEDDYFRIISDYDFSKNDGLLFGNPGLEYFSSSYNNSFSCFLRSLGLNSLYHAFDDSGINTVTAYFLGVEYASEYINGFQNLEMYDHLKTVYVDETFALYRFEDYAKGGFALTDSDNTEFTYNVFQNINSLYDDISDISDVFIECESDLLSYEEEDSLYKREMVIYPKSDSHLYFYISPVDYIENNNTCFDELYIGNDLIANFKDVGRRYIVDLGYSDGSPLSFTFVTGYSDNEVYFYSFDEEAFEKAITSIDPLFTSINYSPKGIAGTIESATDSEAVLLIPYENGFTVRIDGECVPYGNYRNGLVKIKIPEGKHDIEITYFTPGLKIGISISLFVFIFFIIILLLERNKHKNTQFNVQNAQKK